MFTDARWQLAVNQSAIVGANAGLISQNTVDQGSIRDVGKGRTLFLVVTIKTTLVGAAGCFVEFGLCTGNGVGLGALTDANVTNKALHRIARSHAYLEDANNIISAGSQLVVAMSPITMASVTALGTDTGSTPIGRQGIGGYIFADVALISAGTFDMDLTLDPPSGPTNYPRGYSVG